MKTIFPKKGLLFSLLVALWPALHPGGLGLYGQEAPDRINAYLDARHRSNDFRGVVLIVRNDSTVFSKGYGAANDKTNQPNTP